MFLRKFPNLEWIQQQSKTNFANQRAEGNVILEEEGWPSVVLNVSSQGEESCLGFSENLASREFTKVPYLLLASMLLPYAIFFHAISIRKQLLK